MKSDTHRNGCHNRPPFVSAYKSTNGRQWIPTFGQPDCQYTKTDAGRVDLGCKGVQVAQRFINQGESMKKQAGFISIELFIVGLVLLAAGGWIANVVKLIGMLDGGMTAMFVARIVGVFAAPLGSVLGFV